VANDKAYVSRPTSDDKSRNRGVQVVSSGEEYQASVRHMRQASRNLFLDEDILDEYEKRWIWLVREVRLWTLDDRLSLFGCLHLLGCLRQRSVVSFLFLR